MKTPPSSTETNTEVGTSVPSPELTERLLRRHSQPLGMIDVQRPQQQYARTAGWVAQRFALLDRWQVRYGHDDSASVAGANMVFASPSQPPTELPQQPVNSRQLARTVSPSSLLHTDTTNATASLEPLRVTRPGRPLPITSHSGQQTGVKVETMRRMPAPSLLSAQNPSPLGPKIQPSVMSRPEAALTPASSEQLRVRRRGVTSRTPTPVDSQLSPSATHAATTTSETGTDHRADLPLEGLRNADGGSNAVDESTASPSAPRHDLPWSTSTALPSPATTLTPVLMRGRQGETYSATRTLRLQRKEKDASADGVGTQYVPVDALPSANRLPPRAAEARLMASPPVPELPMSHRATRDAEDVVAVPPLVQRRVVDGTRVAKEAHERVAVAPAIAAAVHKISPSAPEPSLVWRQKTKETASDQTVHEEKIPLPLASSVVRQEAVRLTRQMTTSDVATPQAPDNQRSEVTQPLSSATPVAQEIDIERLADQVSEVIGRRLEIERERRGMTRWN